MFSKPRLVHQLLAAASLALLSQAALAADRKIIILQALTGGASFVGVPTADGMEFAADELNARSFLGSADKIVYEVVDSASARAQAMAAVTRYAADPCVLFMLGPTTAVEAIPAAGVANDAKIGMKALTNAVGLLNPGPWGFISTQPPVTTMPLLGDYAINVAKVKACATVRFSDNEAYVDTERIFVEHVEKRGMKIVDRTGVKQADTDFSTIATRIVAAKPDCVMLFTLGPTAANLAIPLKQAGLPASVKLLSQTGVASPQLIQIGGAAIEGLTFNSDWIPGGDTPAAKAFAVAYKARTGKDADQRAALGYSLMTVVASAVKSSGPSPTRESVRDALTRTKDVPVVVGTGRYSYVNRIPTYGTSFLMVKDGKFVEAPRYVPARTAPAETTVAKQV